MFKINCVQIEITNCCNYRCANCPRGSEVFTRKKGYMPIDLFRKVLKESFKASRFINFSFFGEPLLHPEFMGFMDIIKDRPAGFKVVMNSNLSLATKKIFDKFIEIDLDTLKISIDAATNGTYDLVRPSSSCFSLDGTKSRTKRLDIIDEKVVYWFGISNHVPTKHVLPVSSLNIHEVLSYVDKWKPLLSSRDEILIKNVLTYGGKNSDPLVSKCSCNVWDQGVLTVDWQGNVSPCNLDTNMDLIVGNVGEQSFLDICSGNKFNSLMEMSKSKSIYPCNKCVDANNWSKNIKVYHNSVMSKIKDSLINFYGQGVVLDE